MMTGRPLKFASVEELEQAIEQYFDACDGRWTSYQTLQPKLKDGKQIVNDGKYEYEEVTMMRYEGAVIPTISGLAVALDTTRRTLLDYEDREEFSHTIKRAKQRIEATTESLLVNGGATPAGVIFNLKNNYGWVDRTETEVSGGSDPIKVLLDKYGVTEGVENDGQADAPVPGSSPSDSQG